MYFISYHKIKRSASTWQPAHPPSMWGASRHFRSQLMIGHCTAKCCKCNKILKWGKKNKRRTFAKLTGPLRWFDNQFGLSTATGIMFEAKKTDVPPDLKSCSRQFQTSGLGTFDPKLHWGCCLPNSNTLGLGYRCWLELDWLVCLNHFVTSILLHKILGCRVERALASPRLRSWEPMS